MSMQKRRREEGKHEGDAELGRSAGGQEKRVRDGQGWRSSGHPDRAIDDKGPRHARGRGEVRYREDSGKPSVFSRLEVNRNRREDTKSGTDETESDEETPREVLNSHRAQRQRPAQQNAEEEDDSSMALVVREDRHAAPPERTTDEGNLGGRQRRRPRKGQKGKGESSSNPELTVFVGDLDLAVIPQELEEAFSRFGEVANVKVIPTQCYGFVTFASREGAQAAHEAEQTAEGVKIRGQRIRIRQASGALPAWKVGAGGFSFSSLNGLPESPLPGRLRKGAAAPMKAMGFTSPTTGNPRDTFQAAAIAAAVTAGSVLYAGGGEVPEEVVRQATGGRQMVAYDDLF